MFNTDKLFSLMKEKGVKTQHICNLLSANRNILYDWKRGKSEPSKTQLSIIAEALNTTPEYFTDGIKKAPSEKDAKREQLIKRVYQLQGEKLEAALEYLDYLAKSQK